MATREEVIQVLREKGYEGTVPNPPSPAKRILKGLFPQGQTGARSQIANALRAFTGQGGQADDLGGDLA